MATETTQRRSLPAVLLGGRVVGGGLTAAMGWIHLYLWAHGYSATPTIGVLFLLNGIGAAVLTVALLGSPARLLGVVAGVAALFTAGTLAALTGSLTVGIFGFQEYVSEPYVVASLCVESVGVVVLGALGVTSRAASVDVFHR